MADSSIVLNTNSSTGSSVDTRTNSGGEHRQVVVIGEGAATSDAVVPADATNGLLTNPSDRAARDNGKVDIAAFDVALPSGTNLLGLVSLNSLGTIATTVSSGTISLNSAGSLAITLASGGALAVVQPTASALNATVTINSSGSTVAASQYGTWTVSNAPGTANIGAVSITSGNLISLNSTGSLSVAQTTPANLNATVWLASGASISLVSGGSLAVAGDVAAGTSDSGNPVKVGGKYNSTLPTLTNGQRGDIQVTSNATVAVTVLPIATGYGYTPKLHDGILAASVVTVANRVGPIAIGGYYIYNPNASAAFVQCFNTNGTVSLGTTAPDLSIGVPATSAANLSFAVPLDFSFALKIAATTTASNATGPSSGLTTNWFIR